MATRAPATKRRKPAGDVPSAKELLQAKRRENTCKNIRGEAGFRDNMGCDAGAIRSWAHGKQTYVKLPGGVLRNVQDRLVNFAVDSGLRKSTHRLNETHSGLLRAADNTAIDYNDLNVEGPYGLAINCPRDDLDCFGKESVMIRRQGAGVIYRDDPEFAGLVDVQMYGEADPISRRDHRQAVRAEAVAKAASEASEKQVQRHARALEKANQRLAKLMEERETKEANDQLQAAMAQAVRCKNVRSIKAFRENADCTAGTIRNFKDKAEGPGYYIKLPNGNVRKLTRGDGFDLDQTQRNVNVSMRYGVKFACDSPDDCNFETAGMQIGLEGGSIDNTLFHSHVMLQQDINAVYDWAAVPHVYRAYSATEETTPLYSMIHFMKYGSYTPGVTWQHYTPLQIYFAWMAAKCVKYEGPASLQPLTELEANAIPYKLHKLSTWDRVVATCHSPPLAFGEDESRPAAPWLVLTMKPCKLAAPHSPVTYDSVVFVSRAGVTTRLMSKATSARLSSMIHGEVCRYYNLSHPHTMWVMEALTIWMAEFDDVSPPHALNLVLDSPEPAGNNLEIEIYRYDARAPTALNMLPGVKKFVSHINMTTQNNVYVVSFSSSRSMLNERLTRPTPVFTKRFGTASGCCMPLLAVEATSDDEPTIYIDNFCARLVCRYKTREHQPQEPPRPPQKPQEPQEPQEPSLVTTVVAVDRGHEWRHCEPIRSTRRKSYYLHVMT